MSIHPLPPVAIATTDLTLADLAVALDGLPLSRNQRRVLHSNLNRVAKLLKDDPVRIPLDIPSICDKLNAVNPVAAGITWKTYANIKSGFMQALRLSGLKEVHLRGRQPLSPAWAAFRANLLDRRSRKGLSRFICFCSRRDIAPSEVTDREIDAFVADVRATSLRRNQDELHRMTTVIWNDLAVRLPGLGLHPVTVPSFLRRQKRIAWSVLTEAFRADVDRCLAWFATTNKFDRHARQRALAQSTLTTLRGYIHAAASALVESGVDPQSITSLRELVQIENMRRILRRRDVAAGGHDNAYNFNIAQALVRIAREWLKVEAGQLDELQWLGNQVPPPAVGMTPHNKKLLRQFDDPAVLLRLLKLPEQLWAEVKRETNPNLRTLAKAQAALAIVILTFGPIRLGNLLALEYDVHLILRDGVRSKSTLTIPKVDVKNDIDIDFEIPSHIATMLLEYRDNIAPKIIGRRPKQVFVNREGKLKCQHGLGDLITRYLKRRAGIDFHAHAFRHLAGELILRKFPGGHVLVKDVLGHKSLTTTLNNYVGIRTRQAGLHHQMLLEETLSKASIPSRRKRRSSAA